MSISKKILFISEFAGQIGGTEKFIFSTAKLLRENGYVCDMLYKTPAKNLEEFSEVFDVCAPLSEAIIPASEYLITTMHRTEDANFLRMALDKYAPTLFVHDHTYVCPKGYKYYPYKRKNCAQKYNRFVCAICALSAPLRHFSNGVLDAVKRNVFEMPLLNKTALSFPKFVVISDFMRNELLKNGVAENKISLLSPYVDAVETAETQPSGKLKILFASQHVASKGLHLLFESLAKMKSDFELTILGEGARTPFYKDLAKEFGIAQKTIFAGFVNNPEDFYKRTDVAVFPSMWQEPFGLVGIEAMAYARPVVAFDVGGVRQWLIDGKNGIIVPERNTTLFAEALDKLAQNPSLVKSLGENGRDFVRANFTRENFLKTFLQLQ